MSSSSLSAHPQSDSSCSRWSCRRRLGVIVSKVSGFDYTEKTNYLKYLHTNMPSPNNSFPMDFSLGPIPIHRTLVVIMETTMHASVGEDLISVFQSLISEGTVYIFTYFGVSNDCRLYRTTSHQFRLFFQDRTTVLPSFCDAIPLYGIKLVPFREIMGYSSHHPFLVDVGGVMTGVEGERKYVNDVKLINMMVIHIENDGVYYREISQYLSVISGKPAYLDEDEVLYSTRRKTIKELRAVADVGFYVVRATVLDVEPVSSWWYKSCLCSVKAEANADEYFCDGCNRDVNNVVDRYKLNLLVFDGTATTNFVVFDKEVVALFGRTCTEMVKELNKKGEASKDPIGFNEFFLDKEFLFKVEVETTGWCDSYDVSVIRSDSEVEGQSRPGKI
ncbi:uncharacterized protein LOC107620728 [Arachis ipaensis]|uniref:uncharacterized protein LOC107620728 n=1 Tax=Arachis ipaensis TaxID=130454 RepID=UPI0007AFC31C|nr:uncharacterized protein LOC107620728 [Arachis ipaensis]